MTIRLASPLVRFSAFGLLAVVLPAAILAVLGYVSLRQWETSAELLFREQARDLDRLLDEVWGYEQFPTTRTVDTHILRLRQKFEKDPEHPAWILTVHGQGYKFAG